MYASFDTIGRTNTQVQYPNVRLEKETGMPEEKAKKLIVIGVDGAIPEFVTKFLDEGVLPNISKLVKNGVFSELIPASYADTPTNWTTIATGAWPGTHGINSFGFHIQGEPFDKVYNMGNNLFPITANVNTEHFMNRLCKAEYIWQAAEKAGKRVILVNFPGGWPTNTKHGLVVDGTGPHSSPVCRMSNEERFCTNSEKDLSDQANTLIVQEARGWKNLPYSSLSFLEST